jgi:hypothetical protein
MATISNPVANLRKRRLDAAARQSASRENEFRLHREVGVGDQCFTARCLAGAGEVTVTVVVAVLVPATFVAVMR